MTAATPLPPGAERRRQLRRQRRNQRLRHLWRLLVFTALAAGLGYGLLRQGWILRSASQVEVSGSTQVSRDQVIQAAKLRFPLPLLSLQPRQLDQTLQTALPVQGVRVTRLMLPPRLRIELQDREAVARAERRTSDGLEAGYVDAYGNWIANRQDQGVRVRIKGDGRVRVIGWNERHRAALGQVLAARERIGPGLRTIRFDPDGSLWLVTGELGELRLGPNDGRLARRLEVVQVLRSSLPQQMKGRRPQLIDLSDPEQPELSLPGGTGSVGAGGPVPSGVPRGAQ
ncbi:MAG: FtsQ-type POTRA domain-containing protein [Synechococcaceae cyanobacterium]|nr:FtsQ-type POTRA domain-containing protein [Synechococcaceae cyanobacterium]